MSSAQALTLLEEGVIQWPPAVIAGTVYLYSNQMDMDGKWIVYRLV